MLKLSPPHVSLFTPFSLHCFWNLPARFLSTDCGAEGAALELLKIIDRGGLQSGLDSRPWIPGDHGPEKDAGLRLGDPVCQG